MKAIAGQRRANVGIGAIRRVLTRAIGAPKSEYIRAVAGETPRLTTRAYDRWLLLGQKRYELLDLSEVQRYGRDSFGDPDFVSLFGLKPAEWYSRGIRLLGRTVVECTRDRFADLIGRDVAAAANAVPGVSGSIVVDPFAGSANTLYWITRHVGPDRSVGFELDDAVFELTRKNLSIMGHGINVCHDGYVDGLKRLRVEDDELLILFISPPWGEALDEKSGLDFRHTTPPVAKIVDLAKAVFGQHKLLFAIQAYESVTPGSLARADRAVPMVGVEHLRDQCASKKPGLASRDNRLNQPSTAALMAVTFGPASQPETGVSVGQCPNIGGAGIKGRDTRAPRPVSS